MRARHSQRGSTKPSRRSLKWPASLHLTRRVVRIVNLPSSRPTRTPQKHAEVVVVKVGLHELDQQAFLFAYGPNLRRMAWELNSARGSSSTSLLHG